MIDWDLAVKIFCFGLGSVFGSLAILIGAIYAFGSILKKVERKSDEEA